MTRTEEMNRWAAYTPVGKPILDSRIIAFKVPMKKEKLANRPPEEWFRVEDLIQKIPNLGLVIDLCNTDKYYDKKELEKTGVSHVKLICVGGSVPSLTVVNRFFSIIEDFLANNESDKLIGVHCTHGLNRTGYLVCRYLMKRHNMTPNAAIIEFEKARGHSIERDEYKKYLTKVADPNFKEPLHQKSNYIPNPRKLTVRTDQTAVRNEGNWRDRDFHREKEFEKARGHSIEQDEYKNYLTKVADPNFKESLHQKSNYIPNPRKLTVRTDQTAVSNEGNWRDRDFHQEKGRFRNRTDEFFFCDNRHFYQNREEFRPQRRDVPRVEQFCNSEKVGFDKNGRRHFSNRGAEQFRNDGRVHGIGNRSSFNSRRDPEEGSFLNSDYGGTSINGSEHFRRSDNEGFFIRRRGSNDRFSRGHRRNNESS